MTLTRSPRGSVTPNSLLGHQREKPATVTDARFVESRLLSVDPESAVYKGIYALIMARGAKDWRTAEPFTGADFAELGTRFSRCFPRTMVRGPRRGTRAGGQRA